MLTSMLLSVAPMSAAKAPSEMVTGHGEPLRSRREIRSLNEGDLQVVYDVLSIMGNTSASDGRSRYGPRFTSLDEFVARHATAAFDECDQGHSSYSPDIPTGAFVTFHQLMILQLERSAEAILGKTFAMPYYNPTEDECPGGKYCGRSDVIDRILGKQYGRASDGTLDEPAFYRNWRVAEYTPANYPASAIKVIEPHIYPGCGFRSYPPPTGNCTMQVQRWDPLNMGCELVLDLDQPSRVEYVVNHIPQNWEPLRPLVVTRAATAICEEQTDINNFLACLCFGTYNTTDGRPCSENAKPSPRAAAQWQKAQCQQLRVHGQGHNKYGSQSIPAKCDSDPATDIVHSLRFDSDFGSLVTSPNDMLFFAVWHNEVLRRYDNWLQLRLKTEPQRDPAKGWANLVQCYGHSIDDVVNANYSFTHTLLPKPPRVAAGYTNREVIDAIDPRTNVMFRYD